MLKKRIIPCLDVKDGRVVKGVNFVDLIDAGDPVEQAKFYDEQGADELTFLDITASSDNRKTIIDVVERTADQVFMPLTVGGGVRNLENIRDLLHAGADKVGINTAAINEPEFVKNASLKFGTQCIVVAVDAKRNGDHWEIYTHGGRNATGIEVIGWCKKMRDFGAGEILLTSMDRDGTKSGFDIPLTKAVVEAVDIPVIASGGVGELSHFYDGFKDSGADATLAASVFHFGTFTVGDVKKYLADKDIPVRL